MRGRAYVLEMGKHSLKRAKIALLLLNIYHNS